MPITSKKTDKPSNSKEVSLAKALDSLNNNIEAAEVKAKKAADEYSNKVTKFNQEYNKIKDDIIIPSMDTIMKLFNTSGHGARLSNKDDETNYPIGARTSDYLGYYFQLKNKYSFLMLISGSATTQKVSIGLYTVGENPKVTLFSLNEITKNHLESVFVSKIHEISLTINLTIN